MHPETAQSQKPDTGWRLRTLFLSLVVTGCIITSLWFATKPKEPMYKGQPFSYWLSRIDETGATLAKHANATECRDAIRAMGTNALSAIIRILNAKDSAFKEKLIDLADRQDMVRVPFHTVEDEKAKAAAALYILGDIATNALPALIDICRHPSSPSSQQIAENTLMRLYPAKGVADPYWEPSERRAQWYIGAGMIQLQSDTASTSSNALLAFSRAIDLEPTNMSALLQRGHTRLQLDQFTNALADFSKIFELSPTNDNAIYGRALCRYGLKDYRGAAAECTKVINWDTNHFQAVNLRGLSRANLRDFKAAQEDFTTALAISSYEPSYYRNRGAVESIQTEYEAALDDVSQSLELDKKDAAAWALRSRILCALKDYHGAITNADIAVQLDPKSAHVYTCRATARMCLKEFDAASHDLDTALRLDSKHANAYLIRGIMTAKRGGADDAALADLERAVELAPTAPDTFGLLGLFQYKISKWDAALANCRKALEMGAILNISSYNSYIWLICAQSGQLQAANGELENYLKTLDSTKTNEWKAITARFFTGSLPESEFLSLATTALKRPSALTNQMCESFFYAAMKRKLAGDKSAARDLFQKCLNTYDDNSMAYLNAAVELNRLNQQ